MCLELWFECDWYFCNITELGSFRKRLTRNKVPTNHFLRQLRSSRTQMFFKIGVLKNFATVKHLCWSLFSIKLKKEEAQTQVFSYEHCEIFKYRFPYKTITSGGCFFQFDKVANCSVSGICRPPPSNQKRNMGWFPVKKIGASVRSIIFTYY